VEEEEQGLDTQAAYMAPERHTVVPSYHPLVLEHHPVVEERRTEVAERHTAVAAGCKVAAGNRPALESNTDFGMPVLEHVVADRHIMVDV